MSVIGRAELEHGLTATEIDRNLWAARWRRASGDRETLQEAGDAMAAAAHQLLHGDRSDDVRGTLDRALSRWCDESSGRATAGDDGTETAAEAA